MIRSVQEEKNRKILALLKNSVCREGGRATDPERYGSIKPALSLRKRKMPHFGLHRRNFMPLFYGVSKTGCQKPLTIFGRLTKYF